MKLEAGTITDTSHSGGGDSVQHTVSRNMGKLTRTEWSVHLSNRRSSKWNYETFTPFMHWFLSGPLLAFQINACVNTKVLKPKLSSFGRSVLSPDFHSYFFYSYSYACFVFMLAVTINNHS